MNLGMNGMMLATLYAGGYLLSHGAITVGELSSFMVYAIYVMYR